MKHILFYITLLACISSNLYGAANQESPSPVTDFSQQKLTVEDISSKKPEELTSQAFYDTYLRQHKDEVIKYTRENFPDLYGKAIRKMDNGGEACFFAPMLKLYKTVNNPDKPIIYALYWLSSAQEYAEGVKDTDQEKRLKIVHDYAKNFRKTRSGDDLEERLRQDVAVFYAMVNELSTLDDVKCRDSKTSE